MRGRRAQMAGFASRFRSSLYKARTETLRNIEANYTGKAVTAKAAAADLMFDLTKFSVDFHAGMRQEAQLGHAHQRARSDVADGERTLLAERLRVLECR